METSTKLINGNELLDEMIEMAMDKECEIASEIMSYYTIKEDVRRNLKRLNYEEEVIEKVISEVYNSVCLAVTYIATKQDDNIDKKLGVIEGMQKMISMCYDKL